MKFRICGLILFTISALFAQPSQEQMAEMAQRAGAAMDAGRFDEAIQVYQELSAALPDVPGIKMNLGLALYLAGQPDRAVSPLKQALDGDPELLPAWLFLGASQLESDQPSEAIATLKRFLERQPQHPQALQMLGDAYSQSGQPEAAIQPYRDAARQNPEQARIWYGLGRAYEAIAAKAFDLIEKTSPESAYWFALIADSRVAQKQLSSAYYFYRKALEAKPDLRGIHLAISHLYREREHPDWAATEEQREAALGPPNCEKEPVACSFFKGDLDSAYQQSLAGSSTEEIYWRTKVANQLAVEAFSKLMELPPSFEVHQLKAEINRNQNRHWESVSEWKKALELEPGHPAVRRELALSLYLNRDYPAAQELVQELLKEDPKSPQLNFLAGDILLYEQKAEQAIPYLDKAVAFDPKFIGAQSSLGRAYMFVGEAEKAIPHLLLALESDEDGSLHYQLARAYQRTGETELAKKTMAKYQEIKEFLSEQEEVLEEEVQITPP